MFCAEEKEAQAESTGPAYEYNEDGYEWGGVGPEPLDVHESLRHSYSPQLLHYPISPIPPLD